MTRPEDRTITITYTGSTQLKVSEVWPDGDAPVDPTAESVARVMREQGPLPRLISEWNLSDDIDVDVEVEDGGETQVVF